MSLPGLHQQVVERLGREITDGTLPEGHTFTTEWLTERYGVSRTIAREALKVLEQHGVVSSRRRVGVTVAPESEWASLSPMVIRWRLAGSGRSRQLRELSELRRGTEPTAARLAADRATQEQRDTLIAAVQGMAATGPVGDLETYLEHDIVFHQTLMAASGNTLLAGVAPLVAEALSGRTHHDLMPTIPEQKAIQWHIDVATAIRDGDADRAARAMVCIVDEAQAAMTELMGSYEGP